MDDPSARRLSVLQGHLRKPEIQLNKCGSIEASAPISSKKTEIQKAFPRKRLEILSWNGWGYKDSGFYLNDKGVAFFTGPRYPLNGLVLPLVIPWMEQKLGFDRTQTAFSQPPPSPADLPPPMPCPSFIEAVRPHSVAISTDADDRLFHSHGHTCHELFILRSGKIDIRLVDAVVWPGCHDHVAKIVQLASLHNICIIPFGGGTNVSGALECPSDERRPIISLDMTEMDKILWIDEDNLTAHVEAGIVGQDLERKLAERGYTSGHEPDSQEFSTLGGWVATRSSGMKKNKYGNIEDLVVRIRTVTPSGTIDKSFLGPRNSLGPDLQHFILGSEGTLGVITEVTMRIRPLPQVRRYGSIVFPTFELGVEYMRDVAKQRCAPASIRLMDNLQFQIGQILKPTPSFTTSIIDSIKKIYVTKFKGFDPDKMAACTLLMEGTPEEVKLQEKRLIDIASKYNGLSGGEENGRRGYMMTFVIAYIRDMAFDYGYLSESFETSIPWSRVVDMCRNVKERISQLCTDNGIIRPPLISCRVTQVYDEGACVYFYLAFSYLEVGMDPVKLFHTIESSARDEVLANGGSLSHHHGVGKIRKKWIKDTLTPTGIDMLYAVKRQVDPQNIFGCANLLP
ncbi:PREDICTED: alkyldihydroxyacetonephosphate synthase, peroxisomal-like [Amphimedon queenslandica]|uniref:Alkylglycerone-phosphate synthase n=1 Tax=Amphimedon queenslandica TaxID=400682 RepID=A0A1X7VB54_AMPQE|nr:PREDICTED: alkyldihydroxyacetonephosphate synthase, peroxisomal-like [Amphimedon queenslandica]|eukprot:XP_003384906.1 PREDICTED: alkyldihydroxyacetonephosphate synthase, peroxisomal-like [Amphimedon queenslandica]